MALSAWLLTDAAYRNSGVPHGAGNKKEEPLEPNDTDGTENNTDFEDKPETNNPQSKPNDGDNLTDKTDNTEVIDDGKISDDNPFVLKNEDSYVQLRLVMTVQKEYREQAVSYMQRRINGDLIYSTDEETVISAPREDYDLVLNTIIDCPHTDNVVYRNENYYPVVQELFNSKNEKGEISKETINIIESIENFCLKIMVVIK